MNNQVPGPLRPLVRLSGVWVFALLLVALVIGVSPNIDSQLVGLGESIWPGYAAEIRKDPTKPDCDLEAIDETLASCPSDAVAEPAGATDADPFAGGDDPFADEGAAPAADPFAGGDDPFADEGAPSATSTPTASDCVAQHAFRDICASRWQDYDTQMAKRTSANLAYRSFEGFIADFATFPYWKHLLVLLVLLGGISTGVHRMHIALRTPRTVTEHFVAQGSQLLAFVLLVVSNIFDYRVQLTSGAERLNSELPVIWAIGFTALAAISLVHLLRRPTDLDGQGSFVRLLMVIPLFTWMVLGSAVYFFVVQQHPSGQAVYLHKFLQFPTIFIGIGLYIWAGMLFSITRLATLVFKLLTPWGLPVGILAWLVVVLAAVPTAYSGASGIFVLAAGAVIFRELTRAGADTRLALAATAMSGSLGVVLAPCLVVVLISVLNEQVTTVELFGNGLYVFALTVVLTLIAFLARGTGPIKLAPLSEAIPKVLRTVRALVPFLLLSAVVLAVYAFVFGTYIDEHQAMMVLPAVLLILVIYDRLFAAKVQAEVELPRPDEKLWKPLVSVTAESADHVGALLMLMAASVALGGIVERSGVMEAIPESLGSPIATMTVLLIFMVIIGMTMDALGAVVLVSVSVASVAYEAGIVPVHFWMMVLVAFELGYLTPPVALNHLLARQVIGEESHVEDDDTEGFWARNEHIVLPMAVMGSALVLVAYVPFLFYGE